ncbi:MAG: 2-hydroxychromene-2-carboxylate isomerase [Granulosicoccus sp.]
MQNTIDFYFDYSSPFGYLASERIEAIALKHNRDVVWHPILLGAVFKITKQAPLTQAPLKGDYSIRDFSRSAREHQLSYQHPDMFPIAAVAACRATIWMRDNPDTTISAKTGDFLHAVFRAYYTQGQDITDVSLLGRLADSVGIDPAQMSTALGEQAVKDALFKEVDNAIQAGVFGSPMIHVDGEPFWGHDRLEQVDRWLSTGGW